MKIKPMFLRNAVRCGAFAAMALIAAACGSKDKSNGGSTDAAAAGPPVTGDWVVIHNLSDPQSLNLLTSSDAVSQEIFGNYFYDALYFLHPDSLTYVPWVAAEQPVESADHLIYDIKLKKEAKFSDGKPVTGEDFIFYLKMVKNPHIPKAGPLRGYFERLKSLEIVDGDKYHIRATMNEPYFLAQQFIGSLYAFPKHIWDPQNQSDKITWDELNGSNVTDNPAAKALAESINDDSKNFDGKYLVASGPYMFESFERNAKLTLKRNPNYWNTKQQFGTVYPDKIVYRTINDQNAAVTSMKNGEIDMYPVMEKINFHREEKNLGEFGMKPAVYDYPAFTYIGYNESNPIFQDKNVRLALSHLIDRESIIKSIYFGLARPVQSPIYYKRPEYDTTIPIIKFDPEKAKQLLAQAGWSDSDGDGVLDKVINGTKTKFSFKLMLNQGNKRREAMALVFVDALKKVGIEASTLSLEWATFGQKLDEQDFQAFIGGWAMNVQEGDLYQIWHSKSAAKGSSNYVQFKNPRVDQLIESIRGEFDAVKRSEMQREIQKIINDEQPYTFLVSERMTGAYSSRFQNVSFFAPRPCYNAGWWWVPSSAQKYKASQPVASN